MTEVPPAAAPNGDAPTLDDDDAAFLAAARHRLEAARARHAAIADQAAAAGEQVKRWERVVRDLDPEPASKKPAAKTSTRAAASKVGPERLDRIVAAIRDLAGDDGEGEFRQVDVRRALDDELTSGVTTLAFRQLREEEVIRFARKQGINQFFRLTRKATR